MKGVFTKCLHPRRIKNPFTGELMIVSCGHCEACLTSKGLRLSSLCQLESLAHRYCMFITLTYNNDNIPLMYPEYIYGNLFFVDHDSGELLHQSSMSGNELQMLYRKSKFTNCLPYLRKSDIQLFMKRLRYYVSNISEQKIRYFVCGEYGPITYRPHYHVLLWFSDEAVYKSISEIVSKSWELGFIRVETSVGDAANYTASYCNCNMSLPQVYKDKATKPFICHSCFLGRSFFEGQYQDVYEIPARDFVNRSVILSGKSRDVRLPRSYISLFFPKCQGFFLKSYDQLSRSYQLYNYAKRKYGQGLNCAKLSRFLASDYIHVCLHHIVEKLWDPFWSYIELEFGLIKPMDDEKELYDILVRKIYLALRVSKRYLEYVVPNTPSYKDPLQMIIDFYKDLQLSDMNDYLEQQENYFSDDNIYELDYMYPQFFNVADFKKTHVYLINRQRSFDIYENRVKHKKLNDANKIFESF